ncbi:hypothetical protein L484_014441 [Morus notabilis]|uniref:Uncharacterized protein n=1 Tax=Morus notabilis TaxID=981085 RepID=W9QRV7_9ROSA|nr:hypothetical protein L484_014441 [Morus notabilis]
MVHFISSGLAETMKAKGSKKAPVKPEIDDSSEPLEPLHKRTKLDSSPRQSLDRPNIQPNPTNPSKPSLPEITRRLWVYGPKKVLRPKVSSIWSVQLGPIFRPNPSLPGRITPLLVQRSLATANLVRSWACSDPRRPLCRFSRASSRSMNAMALERADPASRSRCPLCETSQEASPARCPPREPNQRLKWYFHPEILHRLLRMLCIKIPFIKIYLLNFYLKMSPLGYGYNRVTYHLKCN